MTLQAPPGPDVRPTSDKLRGAVMSMLGGFLSGERVLDVCAGTGAVALEWLSRGASTAVAIESDPVALEAMRANAKHVRLDSQLTVVPGDAIKQLTKLAADGQRFDLVYVDPPYDAGLYETILAALPDVLNSGAQVFVESREGLTEAQRIGWTQVTQRRYGGGWLDRLQWPEVAA